MQQVFFETKLQMKELGSNWQRSSANSDYLQQGIYRKRYIGLLILQNFETQCRKTLNAGYKTSAGKLKNSIQFYGETSSNHWNHKNFPENKNYEHAASFFMKK